MDKYQRRMQRKRDEYLPKRRKGLSRIERERQERERVARTEYDEWLDRANRTYEQNPYHIRVDSSLGFSYILLSRFPQRYPQYDELMIELQQDWQKRQAVRCCRLIKEELMMNRWHPDRVEKLLELGVLDDLD